MTQRPLPTEPLCDQPPPGVFYLDRRAPSSQRGGTKIAEDVTDWETHLQRVVTPDGYRPERCDHCGGRRLHGHGLRTRVLAGDELGTIDIRRYRCAVCRAVWQVLPGFVARRLWRRWRSRLRSDGRRVRHVLSVTQRPELEAVVRRVPVACTRGDVLAAYRAHAPGSALRELAALLHRVTPGLRMM